MDGAKKAIRGMIDHITASYDLSPTEAYMLCSVLADLQIDEVVNDPSWVVSAHVPERPLEPARADE